MAGLIINMKQGYTKKVKTYPLIYTCVWAQMKALIWFHTLKK
jgi:hypothetical protein